MKNCSDQLYYRQYLQREYHFFYVINITQYQLGSTVDYFSKQGMNNKARKEDYRELRARLFPSTPTGLKHHRKHEGVNSQHKQRGQK